jgi:transcriptional regulator with PAS, ATPase and Fis domain
MNLIEAKAWADEMDVQVTVCDLKGIIVYMNKAAASNFSKYGGGSLIGQSLFDCHNEHSAQLIKELLLRPSEKTYAIPKAGFSKLIRHVPWMENGTHKGIIEIGFNLPSGFSVRP